MTVSPRARLDSAKNPLENINSGYMSWQAFCVRILYLVALEHFLLLLSWASQAAAEPSFETSHRERRARNALRRKKTWTTRPLNNSLATFEPWVTPRSTPAPHLFRLRRLARVFDA